MAIKNDVFYKVVYNNEAFIVVGKNVDELVNGLTEIGRVIVRDIGGGYYNAPYTKDSTLMIQELYYIKHLELRGEE